MLSGALLLLASLADPPVAEVSLEALAKALTFHAGFDGTADADFALGDARLHTSKGESRDGEPGLRRDDVKLEKEAGRHGGALRFGKRAGPWLFFKAAKNVDYRREDWSGTVSLWLRLDPDQDLEPGYCDPLQITDEQWDRSAFFVDFSKDERPRHFRLGVFADYEHWNPQNRKWEEIAERERPMVVVTKPPFSRQRWTQVAWTFSGFNRKGEPGAARFYLDGKPTGALEGKPQIFTWDPEKAVIFIGLYYIGLYDELAVFNRALSEAEIAALHGLPRGVRELHPPRRD